MSRNLSATKLCELAGLKKSRYYNIEAGLHATVTVDDLIAIAKVYEITPNEILDTYLARLKENNQSSSPIRR